jgi:serine/arginine repetitive matrix protein 2
MPEVTAPPFGREDSDDITLEQRKKALEEALFGSQPMAISAHPEPTSDVDMPSETLQYSDREGVHQLRNQNPTPPDIRNDDQLLRDVERMATAATAALKRSPSAPREDAAALSRNKSTKKIYRGQISTPYLVSATTSVDTIPIPSLSSTPPPNAPSGAPLKLSDRFKRLRGNLRAKPLQPNGEEVTPWSPPPPATPASASSGQMVNYQQKVTSPSVRSGPSGGSLESRQYKFPAPQSTPTSPAVTSPQPGKKGFWDRFRKKPKDVDVSDVGSPVREAKISTSHPDWGAVRPAPSPMSKATPLRPALPPTIVEPRETLNSPPPDRSIQFSPPPLSPPVDVRALQMLYEAANALGLDKEAVKGLVDSKSNDRATSPSPTVQSSKSGAADDPRRALQTATLDATVQQIVKSQNALVPFQPPSQSHSDNGVAPSIVRRTIYLRDPASDSLRPSLDISERGASPLSRKVTNKHRRQRSTSAASASGSVFDRSPTPPPPRGSKRLSAGPSPPLPNSPVAASFNNDSQRLNVPRASYTSSLFQSMNGETTTSTQGYDSLWA